MLNKLLDEVKQQSVANHLLPADIADQVMHAAMQHDQGTVSYTHLTLPTTPYV